MKEIISAIDRLPKLVKLLLALPFLDIVWAVYRLCRSIDKNSAVGILLAVATLFLCPTLLWIADVVTIAADDKVVWID